MTTRHERVVLDLEDRFSAGMVKAAAATALLDKNLDSLSGRAVETRRSVSDLNRSDGLPALGRNAETSGKQIDRLSGRLALFAQAAAVLGPALVPIGAVAVPAVAGLTLQLGLAVGAAGVAVLAFKGVGGALKALDTYQLKPTAENFAKLQDTLDKLGPAGQEFVLALDKMKPEFQRFQDLAQAGLLPGVTDGLEEFIALTPQVESVIFNVAGALGDLTREAGQGLGGENFQRFFDYLDVTARPVLMEMGRTFGNFVEGIANMVVAFDPLSRSFSTGLLDMSRSFAEWSANLSSSQGFQDFVEYVQKSGPLALDALGSLGNALIQLIEAAAPVGTAVLPVITALADAFSALADSGAGPALIATAAAVSVLSRSMALLGLNAKGLTGGGIAGAGIFGVDKMRASATAIGTVTTATDRARLSTAKLAKVEAERAATARTGAVQFGKNAALLAGLAIATTGVADKTGLANTASFALMGTIAGPWGTAIGGGIGLVSDLASSNNDLEGSIRAVDAATKSSVAPFQAQQAALKNLRDDVDGVGDSFLRTSVKGLKFLAQGGGSPFRKDSDPEGLEALRKRQAQTMKEGTALAGLSARTGGPGLFGASAEEMDAYLAKITPALQAAGLELKDIGLNAGAADAAIHAYAQSLDSASGKSAAVGAAMAAMGDEIESNVTQADALKAALDSLFGVQLSQSAATDAWTQNLRDLRKAIGETNGAINGTSDAALKNRAAIRGSVQSLNDKVSADAAAGVSGRKLVDSLVEGRQAIIRQAVAAGASKEAVRGYLAQLGMTPKNLATIITQPGMLSAKQQAQALGRLYGLTPKQVHTLISQAGMGKSTADITALARKYGLTPKQVTTLLKAIDQASGTIGRVGGLLSGLNGRVATTFIRTINQHVDQRLGPVGSADGSTVPKTGLPYADRHLYLLADGEEVISNRFGQADRNRGLLKAINANRLADGGTAVKKPETPSQLKARLEKEQNAREAAAKHRRDSLQQFDLVGGLDIKALRDEFRGLREDFHLGRAAFRGLQDRAERVSLAYLKQSAALDESKQVLDTMRSDKEQYAGTVTGAYSHDPFGNGIAGLKVQLEADRNDAIEALNLSRTLDAKGVDQGLQKALLASGDRNTLSQLAGLSRGDLASYSNLYRQSTAATGALGQYAAADQYNKQIAAQSKLITAQTATLHRLNERINGIEAAVERGARAGVGDQNKTAAQRRKVGK